VMRTAIEWGRHGDVFEYNFHTGLIHLSPDEPEEVAASRLE
jgi:NitT/TauT family transport system ATP-binding protein